MMTYNINIADDLTQAPNRRRRGMFTITFITSVLIEQTWFLPDDASRFDPITSFDTVQNHAGEQAVFLGFEAYYVRSDGTLDLYADYSPAPYVDYEFYIPQSQPDNAPPLGAGTRTSGQWYEPVTVEVYRPWKSWSVRSGSSEYTYSNLGMDRETGSIINGDPGRPATIPTCSLQRLWSAALEYGAPAEAVAIITYDVEGYHFVINSTEVDLKFDRDCRLQSQ
jgi:hypothetical protein